MIDPRRLTLQGVLAAVVSIGWLAVVLVPIAIDVKVDQHVQLGVQAAMMLILGAIFGVQIVRRGGDDGSDQS